jgi:hypothetical protein
MARVSRLLCQALMLVSTGVALGQTSSPRNTMARVMDGPTAPSKTISRVHQPVGVPHKASSFAPHRTGRRVFGDPIQGPIVHNVTPPKKPAPR